MMAPTSTNGRRGAIETLMLALAVSLGLLSLPGTILAPTTTASGGGSPRGGTMAPAQAAAFPERNPNREGAVYDTVDILTTAEEKSIQTDITRASGLGLEMLVYTRMSEQSEAESQVFADRLNAEWDIESTPGANDGLVYLLTVNPIDPATNSIVVSAGAATLPIRQFDQAALTQVLDTEMAPELAEGEFGRALQYGLRRVLNAMEYSPPAPEPLTSLQEGLHKAANIAGAMLLQFAVVGYIAIALIRERRFTLAPGSRTLSIYAVCLGASSSLVGIISIAGRNAFGSLTALLLLILAACFLPLVIGAVRQRDLQTRRVRVAGRARGRIKTIGSTHG